MHLVSRSFASHGDQLLGAWSLNLACWPEGLSVKNFADTISEFVPRAVHLDVTAEGLNTGKWRPVKDFTANRLIAGQLQLAAGTLLMLDETKMAEGQLVHEGVKNVNAIRALVSDHQLTCDFTYDVKIPFEVQTMNLSRRKSIISDIDVLVPLRPGTAGVASMPAEALDAVRLVIALVTRNPRCARIPEAVTQKFSEDYAGAREKWGIQPQLCNAWMSLARAYCLTSGDDELTMERWAKVFELEHERLRRCKEENFLSP